MSANFLRVKKDILADMQALSHVDGDAWADIMLRHSKYCVTEEDQISFWNFILNPFDNREFKNPEYTILEKPIEVQLPAKQTEEHINDYELVGGTLFMKTRSVNQVNAQDDEDEKVDQEEEKVAQEDEKEEPEEEKKVDDNGIELVN